MAQVDAAVRRVLTLKERLGLFEDPYRRGATAERCRGARARRRLARDAGAKSVVLLNNRPMRCRCTAPCSASP